jgi:hypothetical protein
MQVHQVVRHPTLQIPSDLVDMHRPSDVDDLAVAEMRLRDRLVDSFVLGDSVLEVRFGVGFRHVLVVWVARGNLEGNIGGDNGRVVADGFEEEKVESGLAGDAFFDGSSTRGRWQEIGMREEWFCQTCKGMDRRRKLIGKMEGIRGKRTSLPWSCL